VNDEPAPPRRRDEPPDSGETPTVVAVLLAVAAVVAAVIGARAALLTDSGSDTWHQTIREDVKRGAALVEDVRFVYTEEAPLAFQAAEGAVRSEEARREARSTGGISKSLLEVHAGAQAGVVETVITSSKLASSEKYATPKGPDVIERLADVRAENPDLVSLDPDATEDRGSELNFEGSMLVATTIPAGLGFLCGALANGFPSRRRWLVPLGFALTGVSLVLALIVEIVH
jgi:hypothetical protein